MCNFHIKLFSTRTLNSGIYKLTIHNKMARRMDRHTYDAEVKAMFEGHTRCNRVNKSSMFTGLQKNRFLEIEPRRVSTYRTTYKFELSLTGSLPKRRIYTE